ncbi:MAG: ammonium transporter [Thermoplasmata archaeon]
MTDHVLRNNLWVLLAALLVFAMTLAVGFLEVGELGESVYRSLRKTLLVSGLAVVVMAVVGFNIGFAPSLGGVIGNPFYSPGFFLGGFNPNYATAYGTAGWSMTPAYFNTGLYSGTYFLFEAAFASVTLALVGVVVLRKVKLTSFAAYSAVYFLVIWTVPASWIWNPSGWLAQLGMVDFAGGLVVHGAAGAAGLGILVQGWREERARGLTRSTPTPISLRPGWLTLAILLLWMGWFGFNPGSVLQFNAEAIVVVLTTFLAASASMLSFLAVQLYRGRSLADLAAGVNGTLMGLIVITPLAGFVSPASALIIGLASGPLFALAEGRFARLRWLSDPVGLLPGHLVGGLFGVVMIPFFAQTAFATGSGYPGLPNGLFFGGGFAAVHQLGVELLGIVAVLAFVFLVSFAVCALLARASHGITIPAPAPSASGGSSDLPVSSR